MWRRVLLVLIAYSTVVVAILSVPLAATLGRERLQRFSENRTAAAAYFANLAGREDGLHGVELRQALDRYVALYDEPVAVFGSDGAVVASAGGATTAPNVVAGATTAPNVVAGATTAPNVVAGATTAPNVVAAASEALRNQRTGMPDAVTPWSPDHVLIAVPIGTGTQVDGAVVLTASLAAAKADVTRAWALIAAGAVTLLAVASLIAVALSRWTVRPLTELAERASSLGRRVLTSAAIEQGERTRPVDGYTGPHEVRRLAAVFDAMSQDVEAAALAQRRLIADSAHALRNPLAALRIRLDTLGMALPTSAVAAHRKVAGEVDRLEGIVADLLALAVAEAPPEGGPEGACADVSAVVVERADFWSAAIAEAGMQMTVVTAGPVQAAIGASDLARILDVALSNAVTHAGSGAHVEVGARAEGRHVHVWVRDDGRGVSEQDAPVITRRFFRAADAVGQGSGLGLSIATALAERAGGALRVDSGAGRGLAVEVRLAGPSS